MSDAHEVIRQKMREPLADSVIKMSLSGIDRDSWNGFNGPSIVSKLKQYRSLWKGLYFGGDDILIASVEGKSEQLANLFLDDVRIYTTPEGKDYVWAWWD